MTTETPPMKSVQRLFEVVQALWKLQGAGPSAVADRLDIPKSTAHVYLRSLESTGYVVNRDGTYELSYQFLTVGSQLKYRNRLFQVSRTEVENLARETGELVTLVIEQEGRTFILHQATGEQGLELGTYPGQPLPLHSHASGKVFLAYMDEDRLDDILEQHGLERATERTITDRERLDAELEQIRERGYAYDWDEQVRGMGVIAVPIIVDDQLEGSLSVVCPTGRITEDSYREDLLQQLRGTADALTIKYQYGT